MPHTTIDYSVEPAADLETEHDRLRDLLDYACDMARYAAAWPERFGEWAERDSADWRWQMHQIAGGRSLHADQRTFGLGANKRHPDGAR